MLSNKEVSKIFKTLADLMELHNENAFKAKSYANAAFQLGRVQGQVMEMNLQQLESTQGIGKSVASKIIELQQTGTLQVLENLFNLTPPGIIDILRLKGLGGKKVAIIWKELGVETVGELLYACYENRLSKLKGFGEKTQQSVIASIEYYQSNLGKYHYATLEKEAEGLLEALQKTFYSHKISLCGEIRRKCNVVEKIEVLIAGMSDTSLLQHSEYLVFENEDDGVVTCKTLQATPVKIYTCAEVDFFMQLFERTGADEHVTAIISKLGEKRNFSSEEEIYAQAGMQFIVPELREEGIHQLHIETSELLHEENIRGVVHNHSTWSDGKNTIEQMAKACMEKGYEYFVISDHSKTAVYAGGLTPEQVLAQHKEIDALNKTLSPFRIFKSIESDILNDGSLDYEESILKQFDLVIASVHSNLKMDEEKATARLLKAIENPYTTILGHMTGRLLLSRPGYPLNHKKIIEACAFHNVIIEINANPYRLDLDFTWIPYALEKGVMISVNPDAHNIDGIGDIHFGVLSARKGGLTKQMTWNCMTLSEIESWLQNRKRKKGIE